MWVLTAPTAHPGSAPTRPARVPTAGGPTLPSPLSLSNCPPCSELSSVPGSPGPGGQCPPSHLAALMRSPGLRGPPHDGFVDAEKRGQDCGFVWRGGGVCALLHAGGHSDDKASSRVAPKCVTCTKPKGPGKPSLAFPACETGPA